MRCKREVLFSVLLNNCGILAGRVTRDPRARWQKRTRGKRRKQWYSQPYSAEILRIRDLPQQFLILGCLPSSETSRLRQVSCPLLCTCCISSGVPAQGRHGPDGASPERGNEDDPRTGASLLWRQAGRPGAVQPGKGSDKPLLHFPVLKRVLQNKGEGILSKGRLWQDKG